MFKVPIHLLSRSEFDYGLILVLFQIVVTCTVTDIFGWKLIKEINKISTLTFTTHYNPRIASVASTMKKDKYYNLIMLESLLRVWIPPLGTIRFSS
jgi:hypothetical protein